MDVITRPRGGGKTYELVHLLMKDEKYLLLVHNHSERDRIIRDYHLLPAAADRIISYSGSRSTRERLAGMLWNGELLVDNVDALLHSVLGHLPRVITVTGRNFDHGRENKTAGDCGDGTVRGGD